MAERAEVGEAREALFGVTIPESPGAFRSFVQRLGYTSVPEEANAAYGLFLSGR